MPVGFAMIYVLINLPEKMSEVRHVLKKTWVFSLIFITLWANSAANKIVIFFLFFSENRIWPFMLIVSPGDNLQEMSKSVFWEKLENYFKMSSAETFFPAC